MSNSYFNFTTGRMVGGENALAEDVNAGFDAVAAGFDKLPTPDATKFLAGAHETTSGSAGNFVLAVTADSYFDGMSVSFKANHSNSGACTLNVGSLGAKSLVDGNGAVLAVGDIVANSIYAARYNSTSDKFHLVGLSSGNAADAAVVAANIADVATIADNIDELLLVDDNAIAAAASASDASGYADDALTQAGLASDYADAASASAANLPNATTAGADKVVVSNATGDGWEYPSITAAGRALLDDADAAAQRATLGFQSDALTRPRKNLLINGGFDVWQRGASFTAEGNYYAADRWFFVASRVNNISLTRNEFSIAEFENSSGKRYYTRILYSLGSLTEDVSYSIRIEDGVRLTAGKTVTLSFLCREAVGKPVYIQYHQYLGGTDYAGEIGTVQFSSSFERKSVTFEIPSVAGKTFGSGDSFLEISFIFTERFNTLVPRQAGTFDICDVQLEFGDTATDFEYRHPAEELALCQRYYEVGSYRGLMAIYAAGFATAQRIDFKVTKRVAPSDANISLGTVSFLGSDATPGAGWHSTAYPTTTGITPLHLCTGGTVGRAFVGQFAWAVDVEL